MGPKYLIDTNTVIGFLSAAIPEVGLSFMDSVIDNGPVLSVITKIELLSFNGSPREHAFLNDFIDYSSVIRIEDEIVLEAIAIRRKKKVKTPDAIIASTAKVLGLTLLTRNTVDLRIFPISV
jgi:predicted nucleic acid-binding protein